MHTAMFAAARSGDAGEIRRLEAAGTDEEESDARGRRPMHVAAEHGHVDVIRTLAESWVLRWIHKTRTETPRGCTRTTATVEDNGAVAEALNALGLEHPGDVIIEPSSYTPDGTPVFTVPPELRAKHASSGLRTGGALR